LSCAATLNNRGSKQKNGCADIVQPFLFCLILPYFALFCLMRNTKLKFYPLTLLILPLVFMLFTDVVYWDWFDFLIMGLLLLFFGFLIEFVYYKVKNKRFRFFWFLIIICLFMIVWAELAVGLVENLFLWLQKSY